jgi:TPP-dependent pyruvate/acetoin dehydrogenase alpha subunit
VVVVAALARSASLCAVIGFFGTFMPAISNDLSSIAVDVLKIRFSQLLVNEHLKKGAIRIPVHLALGHEAIAVALARSMKPQDAIVLSHRNLHYNLAFGATLSSVLDEFYLKETGLAGGELGSMNLSNSKAGIVYTSSILGNNLPVAAGVAFAERLRNSDAVTAVVTGDGAMEEGAFYESLLLMNTFRASAMIIIENNGWSLATEISQRRCPIDVAGLAKSVGTPFHKLSGNSVSDYVRHLQDIRRQSVADRCPVVIEVELKTLGDWRMINAENPDGKYINYHAGTAPKVELSDTALLTDSTDDPVHVLGQQLGGKALSEMASDVLSQIKREIA